MNKSHGRSHRADPTYECWLSMRRRCANKGKARYGGRGITVCDRWNSFEAFLEDMGEKPEGKTLDRYPDGNGNYEPGNCRWATRSEQQLNREGYNKDKCVNGHDLVGWNLSMRKGYKSCVTCRRNNSRKRAAKRRELNVV